VESSSLKCSRFKSHGEPLIHSQLPMLILQSPTGNLHTSRETQTLGARGVSVTPSWVLTLLRVRQGAWQE
jgi:hypothetical protein